MKEAVPLLEAEIADLLACHGLPASAVPRVERLLGLLHSDPRAPTTVRTPEQALLDHVADSLTALALPEAKSSRTIADLGSGAGFPGLMLALALPRAQVWLVESQRRKCEFIERALQALELRNARVICCRAEELPAAGPPAFDLVTARALAPLPVVAEYAAPLMRIGGALVVWRGRRDPAEEVQAGRAVQKLGLGPAEVLEVKPYPAARDRHLHKFVKQTSTPSRFPRRPGMAAKRPLGAPGRPQGPGGP